MNARPGMSVTISRPPICRESCASSSLGEQQPRHLVAQHPRSESSGLS